MKKNICMMWVAFLAGLAYGTAVNGLIIENGEVTGMKGSCPETLVIPEGIRGIGSHAFCSDKVDVSKMRSICMASSVTNIGEAAFYGCTNVTEVIFPEGAQLQAIDAYAFQSCKSLVAIDLPAGVQKIGGYAFTGCDSLREFAIPASVSLIGDRALIRCLNMDRIEVDPANGQYKSVDGVLYDRSGGQIITCPAGKEGTLMIEEGVYFMDTEACSGCSRLMDVKLPSGLMNISYGAFKDCSNLKSITLPSSVEYIEMYAFSGCTALETINIPPSVRWVGGGAFGSCESLSSYWNDGVLIIDGIVADCDYSKNTPACLPQECRLIAEFAFLNAVFLPSVIVPETVRSIGEDAFAQCESLVSVTYLGDAPKVMQSPWEDGASVYCYSSSVTNFVRHGSRGWNREGSCDTLPELWPDCDGDARPIFYDEDLPPLRLPGGLNYTEQVGDYTWTFKIENGEAVIGTYDERGEAINDYAEVSAVSPMPLGVVEIPSRLGGCPVVGIDDYALQYAPGATDIVFPDTLRWIGVWAFNAWWSLTSVELPSCLEWLGDGAFVNCCNLMFARIPASVCFIGEGVFGNCRVLESVKVDCESWHYMSEENALYDINKEKLLFWPCSRPIELPDVLLDIGDDACSCNWVSQGKGVVIPSSVTNIGRSAFYDCGLTKIDLPEGLVTIGGGAFGYNDITNIEIPSSVVGLDDSVFTGCDKLQTVCFMGNAPSVDMLLYQGSPENLVTYVPLGSFGWKSPDSAELPDSWPMMPDWQGVDFSRTIRQDWGIPFPVTGLEATSNWAGMVRLAWDESSHAAGYAVYRSMRPSIVR